MKKLQQFLLAGLAAILVACPTPIVLPTITTFTATPESLPIGGGSSTLAWSTTNADTLTIDQGVGVVTGTEKAITVTATKSYTLTATNSAGSVQKTVTITVATGKPVISTFTATPASLPVGGGSSTLAWTVAGADTLSIDKAVGTVTGTEKAVTVNATTTYTLTATNSLGSETKAVTVTVAQPVEPPANVISGTITPWTRGARILKGVIFTIPNAPVTAAIGTFSQAGQFEMTLPDTVSNLQSLLTTGACGSNSFVLTPPDAKGATVDFGVETTNGALSGSLVRANNSNPSSQSAGTKRAFYYFSDKASTLTGTCSSNGSTQTANATFKQGWNILLVEFISSNSLRISTDSVPSDVTWRFIPSGVITISNPKPELEVSETTNLVTTAADGYEFLNSELEWTSNDSTILEVNASGVVTAKKLGNTQLNVQLKNTSLSATTNIAVVGFTAFGNTFNIEDTALGTSIRLVFSNGTGGPTLNDIPITIIGPLGWNNNQPLNTIYKSNGILASTTILSEIPPVSGSYTVRRATQTTGGTVFIIDATQKLPTAKNVVIRTSFSNNPILKWDSVETNPSAQLEYYTEVTDAVTGEVVQAKQSTYGNEREFYGLNLSTSRTYKFSLFVQDAPYYSTQQFFGASVASAILDFRPIITQIGSRGGLAAGGNSLAINGAYFDINTKVFFGAVEVTSKTLTGSQSMTVIAPAGTVGTVDITLQNSRGTSTTSALSKYTYYAVTEFSTANPTNLLKGENGNIYFLENETSGSPPNLILSRVSLNSSVTRLVIPNIPTYSARDMTLDAQGNVWIASETKFVKVTPSNVISETVLPTGVKPAAIAFGADGNIWFSRTDSFKIGRIQPDGTNLVEFVVPSANFASSFSVSNELVLATDSNIWFTASSTGIGRISASGAITILSNVSGTGASTILVHDNALWLGSTFGNITRVTYNGEITNVGACGGSNPVVGSDNHFWCASSALFGFGTNLGRLPISTVASNATSQTIQVGTSNMVSGIASDSNGNIWFIVGNTVKVLTP